MIVLPMAGLSGRFAREGFNLPKYMLPLADRPMLDWSILSFCSRLRSEPVLFIFRDVADTARFVRARAMACGVRKPIFVQIASTTEGQAETVVMGLDAAGVDDGSPLSIFNIDTLRPGLGEVLLGDAAGLIEVVRASGDQWSFVMPDPHRPGRALAVAEKERISDLCCTGLYTFRSAGEFRRVLSSAARTAGELYIAPMYNQLIAEGAEIRYREITSDRVFFSGTPEEYRLACARGPEIKLAYAAELNRS